MSGFLPGHTLGGKYKLVAPLGRGAMGEVWRAEHLLLRTPLALKLIHPQELLQTQEDQGALLERFFREAQAAAALRSPHVVQILDYGQDGGTSYIAMELLEGETLEQRLSRARVLSPRQTADIITHVARAVGKAHEAGIIHRDLKPGNVFLVKNDDEEIAKVLDFGIAKFSSRAPGARATQVGAAVGTPAYMSPEQIQAMPNIDARSDLWSLAILAFECLTGQLPFHAESIPALVLSICVNPLPVPSAWAAVPPGFDAWFAKGASRRPDERFQSAKELAESLRAVLCPEARASQPSLPPASGLALALAPTVPNPPLLSEARPAAVVAWGTPIPAPRREPAPPAGAHRGVISIIQAPPRRAPWSLLAGVAAGVAVAATAAALLLGGDEEAPPGGAQPEAAPPATPMGTPGPTPLSADPVEAAPAPSAGEPARGLNGTGALP